MTIKVKWLAGAVSLILISVLNMSVAWAEVKLDYRQRQAVERQIRNMAEIEKKITAGDTVFNGSTKWLTNKLDSIIEDLKKNKAPEGNIKVADLISRVTKARATLEGTSAPKVAAEIKPATRETEKKAEPEKMAQVKPPKLAPSARAAVDRQWKKVQQEMANLMALNEEVDKAVTIKKWDDRGIAFKLQGVLDDLNKNRVPKDHPYYLKIDAQRINILTSLENVKAKADPKIAIYADSVNLENYPDVHKDLEQADHLAHLYQNVNVQDLENPAKVKGLLSQANQIPKFIADTRSKYAPLIENKKGPGHSLNVKLSWLEGNFSKFQITKKSFIQIAPGKIEKELSRASSMSIKAKADRNPRFFTGGVQQALDKAKALLGSLILASGEDDATVMSLKSKLKTADADASTTAKTLEEEIIASNRAPDEAFKGSGGSDLINQMTTEWKKRYPEDKILGVRIVAQGWVHEVGYDWQYAFSRLEKYDRQWLKMAVIIQNDDRIALIYPAFINRDNMILYNFR